jgi:hypothetical protein
VESRLIDAEKAIAVIEADQIIHGALVQRQQIDNEVPARGVVCESPGHCALGALLFKAGMTNEQLAFLSGDPEDWNPKGDTAELMQTTYGLRRLHAHEIMMANDSEQHAFAADPMDVRKARVAQTVRLLAIKQAADPARDRADCDKWDHSHWQWDEDESDEPE